MSSLPHIWTFWIETSLVSAYYLIAIAYSTIWNTAMINYEQFRLRGSICKDWRRIAESSSSKIYRFYVNEVAFSHLHSLKETSSSFSTFPMLCCDQQTSQDSRMVLTWNRPQIQIIISILSVFSDCSLFWSKTLHDVKIDHRTDRKARQKPLTWCNIFYLLDRRILIFTTFQITSIMNSIFLSVSSSLFSNEIKNEIISESNTYEQASLPDMNVFFENSRTWVAWCLQQGNAQIRCVYIWKRVGSWSLLWQ